VRNLDIARPSDRVGPAELELVRSIKAGVLPHPPARSLGVDSSTLGLYRLDHILEVRGPWSDHPLILAPGGIWRVCEAPALLLSSGTLSDGQKIAGIKTMFDTLVRGATRVSQ
jgi:hypothetical protein